MTVYAATGCPWIAQSNATWLTTSGSGSGTGTAVYSVTPNGSASPRTGMITIADKTLTVTQDGVPAASPSISVSPTSLNFGYVSIDGPVAKTVNVSNKGTGDLTINSVSIGGTYAQQFRQTGNCTTVAPGSSCTITVTFAPTTTGTKRATLSVYSNDSAKNSVSISLSGIGSRYNRYGR